MWLLVIRLAAKELIYDVQVLSDTKIRLKIRCSEAKKFVALIKTLSAATDGVELRQIHKPAPGTIASMVLMLTD